MFSTRWDPWADMFAFRGGTGSLLNRFFSDWSPLAERGTSFSPAVEVFAREGDLVVRAELPGIDPEKDVDITLHDGVLSIRGERRKEQEEKGERYFRQETFYGSFQRDVLLPEGVNADQIKASYEKGILEVTVPGAASLPEAKKIHIEVGSGERKALEAAGQKS